MGIASNPLAFHQLQCKILFAVHEPHPFVEASTTNSHGQHCECGHNVITWYWTLHPFGTPWKKARFQAFSWTEVRTNLHNCTPSWLCCCYNLLQMLRYFQDQLPFGSYWGDITCSWFWCPRVSNLRISIGGPPEKPFICSMQEKLPNFSANCSRNLANQANKQRESNQPEYHSSSQSKTKKEKHCN